MKLMCVIRELETLVSTKTSSAFQCKEVRFRLGCAVIAAVLPGPELQSRKPACHCFTHLVLNVRPASQFKSPTRSTLLPDNKLAFTYILFLEIRTTSNIVLSCKRFLIS